MKILLDTNSLLIPGKFRVDVFMELERFGKPELYTIDLVVSELKIISHGNGSDASHANLGMELIEKKGVKVLETDGEHADDEIKKLAVNEGYVVCTQDIELQKSLKEKGVKVLSLRQGSRLEMI
jgi:rRNA-processing protein FCF1